MVVLSKKNSTDYKKFSFILRWKICFDMTSIKLHVNFNNILNLKVKIIQLNLLKTQQVKLKWMLNVMFVEIFHQEFILAVNRVERAKISFGDQIKILKKKSNLNIQVKVVIQTHVIQNILLLSCLKF